METFTFTWNNITWYMQYDLDNQAEESPNIDLLDFESEEGDLLGAYIETSWLNSATILEIKTEALSYLEDELLPTRHQTWAEDYADFLYHQQKEEF